ncbi:MAG: PilZ domain-containing protein [Sphingomonadaceae bacterium]|nr:PilZ domain-containing protein [Sphingomonadaceae bacterium]
MQRALKPRDHRRAQRLDVRLEAELREPGSSQRFEVTVVDLSVVGFRCETSFTLKPGQRVFVTIPGLGPIEAVVEWRRLYAYGCSFDRPLHTAVFDLLVARHRKR